MQNLGTKIRKIFKAIDSFYPSIVFAIGGIYVFPNFFFYFSNQGRCLFNQTVCEPLTTIDIQLGKVSYKFLEGVVISKLEIVDTEKQKALASFNGLNISILDFLLQNSISFVRADSLFFDSRFIPKLKSKSNSHHFKDIDVSTLELRKAKILIKQNHKIIPVELSNLNVNEILISNTRQQFNLKSVKLKIKDIDSFKLKGVFDISNHFFRGKKVKVTHHGNQIPLSILIKLPQNTKLSATTILKNLEGNLVLEKSKIYPKTFKKILNQLIPKSNLDWLDYLPDKINTNDNFKLQITPQKWTSTERVSIQYNDEHRLEINPSSFYPNDFSFTSNFDINHISSLIKKFNPPYWSEIDSLIKDNNLNKWEIETKYHHRKGLDLTINNEKVNFQGIYYRSDSLEKLHFDLSLKNLLSQQRKITLDSLNASFEGFRTDSSQWNFALQLPKLKFILDQDNFYGKLNGYTVDNQINLNLNLANDSAYHRGVSLDMKWITEAENYNLFISGNGNLFSLNQKYDIRNISFKNLKSTFKISKALDHLSAVLIETENVNFIDQKRPYSFPSLFIDFEQNNQISKGLLKIPNQSVIEVLAQRKNKPSHPLNLESLNPLIKDEIWFEFLNDFELNVEGYANKKLIDLGSRYQINSPQIKFSLINEEYLYFDLSTPKIDGFGVSAEKLYLFNYSDDNLVKISSDHIVYQDIDMKNINLTSTLDLNNGYSNLNLIRNQNDSISLQIFHSLVDSSSLLKINLNQLLFQQNQNSWKLKQPTQTTYNLTTKDWKLDSTTIAFANQQILFYGETDTLNKQNIHLGVRNLLFQQKFDLDTIFGYHFPLNLDASISLTNGEIHSGKGQLWSKQHNLNDSKYDSLWGKFVYTNQSKSILLHSKSYQRDSVILQTQGELNLAENLNYEMDILMNHQPLNLLNPMAGGEIRNFTGTTSAWVNLKGDADGYKTNGKFIIEKGGFTIDYLNIGLTFEEGSVIDMVNTNLLFEDLVFYENTTNTKGTVSGNLLNDQLVRNWILDLDIKVKNFKALDKPREEGQYVYGIGYGSGNILLKGPVDALFLDINADIIDKTDLVIPIDVNQTEKVNDFIVFRKKGQTAVQKNISTQKTNTGEEISQFSMNLNFNILSDALLTISAEDSYGDVLTSKGVGSLNLKLTNGDFNIFGEYQIKQGTYLFTLNQWMRKVFTVGNQSSIRWNGEVTEGQIALAGIYQTRTRLDQFLQTYDNTSQRPIEVEMNLSGVLSNPNIQFNLDVPYEQEQVKAELQSYLFSEDEKRKQAFALLTTNSLLVNRLDNNVLNGLSGSSLNVLASQFSHLISSISSSTDIQLIYNDSNSIGLTDTDNLSNNVELALTQRFLNDRLTLNSNIGVNISGNNPSSTYLGNFEVRYDLMGNNKINLRYFSQNNQTQNTISSTIQEQNFVQGFGVDISENFDSFTELFRRMFNFKKNNETSNEIQKSNF